MLNIYMVLLQWDGYNATCDMVYGGNEKELLIPQFRMMRIRTSKLRDKRISCVIEQKIKESTSMQKLCLDGSTYGYDSPYFICSISLTPFLLIPYATLLFLPSIVRFLSCYYTAQRGLSFIKCKIYSELQILNYTQLLVLSAANVKYFSRWFQNI